MHYYCQVRQRSAVRWRCCMRLDSGDDHDRDVLFWGVLWPTPLCLR